MSFDYGFHELLHVVEPLPPDHRQGWSRRPFPAFHQMRPRLVNCIENDFLCQIQVEPAVFDGCRRVRAEEQSSSDSGSFVAICSYFQLRPFSCRIERRRRIARCYPQFFAADPLREGIGPPRCGFASTPPPHCLRISVIRSLMALPATAGECNRLMSSAARIPRTRASA